MDSKLALPVCRDGRRRLCGERLEPEAGREVHADAVMQIVRDVHLKAEPGNHHKEAHTRPVFERGVPQAASMIIDGPAIEKQHDTSTVDGERRIE